jgi:hypothetical protein
MSIASVSFASTSVTWDTLQFTPSPLFLSIYAHRTSLLAAAALQSSTRALTMPLPPFKGLRVFPRSNQPLPLVYFPSPALCCAQLLIKVRQRRRRAISPQIATLRCFYVGAMPTSMFVTLPRPPWGPQHARVIVSGRPPPCARAAPPFAARETGPRWLSNPRRSSWIGWP